MAPTGVRARRRARCRIGAVTHAAGSSHTAGEKFPPTASQTLDRGIRVIELLARPEHASGLTVTEVAEQLGVGRTIVYRLLATLEPHELVARAADGRLILGLGMTRFAAAVLPRLRSAALPSLRQLADSVGATAHFTIVEGDQAVAIAVVEPTWTQYHVAYRVGTRHELSRGAAGKAILRAREGRAGAVRTDSELQPGACGVAAPVTGITGLEGSVGVVSLSGLDTAKAEREVLRAAEAVSAALR